MPRAVAAAAAFWRLVSSPLEGEATPALHWAVMRTESKPADFARSIFAPGSPHFAASSTAPTLSPGPANAAGAVTSAATPTAAAPPPLAPRAGEPRRRRHEPRDPAARRTRKAPH